MSGRRIPAGWQRISADGPGPFVTHEVLRRPDGKLVHWHSRAQRKGRRPPAAAADTATVSSGPPIAEPVWWRPRRRSWWMSVLFSLGSLCFALAAIASQWAASPRPSIGVTFFVGSLLFTSAAYLQYAEAVNTERGLQPRHVRWRPASWEPRRIDWLASLVQLVGTIFFNISTFAAMKHGLTTRQANTRVWAPDVFGSICFLIASELAYAEVCHRWICLRGHPLSWQIVALNLLGSIAFGVAAVASLIEPSSGELVSARVANGGTALGGICFLIAALALMPEAAAEERVPDEQTVPDARTAPDAQTGPAPAPDI